MVIKPEQLVKGQTFHVTKAEFMKYNGGIPVQKGGLESQKTLSLSAKQNAHENENKKCNRSAINWLN